MTHTASPAEGARPAGAGRSAKAGGPKEAVILTHMLGRFLDDFGNVVQYLERDGYQLTIYASPPVSSPDLSIDSPDLFQQYRDRLPASIQVKPLPYVRGLQMRPRDVGQLVALGNRLSRERPDAVFIIWSVYLIIAMGVPLRLRDRKSVYLITGLGPVLGSKGRRFVVFRSVIKGSYTYLMSGRHSRALNHNHDDKVFLAKALHAAPDKFFVTPGCGVDPELFPFFEERPGNEVPVILVPARLIEDKGIKVAIRASAVLRDRGMAHEMWFTGAVEPYPWIRITENEIEVAQRDNPSIKFIGYQPSMVPVYRAADVVCYPTRYPEGTPTVLIEAAATGRVGVTCDTVGAREIVLNERTGLVVPQEDHEALTDALARVLSDDALYNRFRYAAHEHFLANYTKDMALEATLDGLETLGLEFEAERTAPDFRRSAIAG